MTQHHRHIWKVEKVHAHHVELRCRDCDGVHSITRGQYDDLVRFLSSPTKVGHVVTINEHGHRVITADVAEVVRLRDGIG